MFLTEYDEKTTRAPPAGKRTEWRESSRESARAIEQGELKKAHEIAANMLKDGMPPEKAKSYVDLGDDQWNELLKSLGMSD